MKEHHELGLDFSRNKWYNQSISCDTPQEINIINSWGVRGVLPLTTKLIIMFRKTKTKYNNNYNECLYKSNKASTQ